ncbi:DUF6292 family protein [Streptomyces sp. G-5]|uniref:DUF6292 family protein n=1 Tax=Streptomyces sp. G-5 TaxID=2977231 RepID=UPI0021D31E2D|nr:DUF6292 family protein [Streptomyces sp. G-5]MCU4750308.1 DUF6292 family protein [Streptomyces sp. G-5]
MDIVRASHSGYITAVLAELVGQEELTVVSHRVAGGGNAPRTAEITLQPLEGPHAEEQTTVVWDEVYGWKAMVPAASGTSDWFMGMSIIPAPIKVATWAEMVLLHPELTPSREDGPSRSPEDQDPAFESLLANYRR